MAFGRFQLPKQNRFRFGASRPQPQTQQPIQQPQAPAYDPIQGSINAGALNSTPLPPRQPMQIPQMQRPSMSYRLGGMY